MYVEIIVNVQIVQKTTGIDYILTTSYYYLKLAGTAK